MFPLNDTPPPKRNFLYQMPLKLRMRKIILIILRNLVGFLNLEHKYETDYPAQRSTRSTCQ